MSEEIIVAHESENVSGTVRIGGAKNSALKLDGCFAFRTGQDNFT